mmetsp:Transcript_48506/g.95693  ORF Transcript_48506/g.95693 Transcript_48506/m.95693 type:complete len:175 (-) Transcript_48506:39-563(-)
MQAVSGEKEFEEKWISLLYHCYRPFLQSPSPSDICFEVRYSPDAPTISSLFSLSVHILSPSLLAAWLRDPVLSSFYPIQQSFSFLPSFLPLFHDDQLNSTQTERESLQASKKRGAAKSRGRTERQRGRGASQECCLATCMCRCRVVERKGGPHAGINSLSLSGEADRKDLELVR